MFGFVGANALALRAFLLSLVIARKPLPALWITLAVSVLTAIHGGIHGDVDGAVFGGVFAILALGLAVWLRRRGPGDPAPSRPRPGRDAPTDAHG